MVSFHLARGPTLFALSDSRVAVVLLLHEVMLSPSVAMIISPRRRRPTGDKVCWAALPAVVTLFKLMAGPALPTRVSNEGLQRFHNHMEGPTWTFSWLKATSSASTFQANVIRDRCVG